MRIVGPARSLQRLAAMAAALALVLAGPARALDDAELPSVELSFEERAWLQSHPSVRMAVSTDYAPFDFLGKDRGHQGVAADYAAIVSRTLGLKLEAVPTTSMRGSLELFRRGRVDVLPAVGRTRDRERSMLFTQPYLSGPWAIVTDADSGGILTLSDLKGKTVAVVGTQSMRERLEESHSDIPLRAVEDEAAALDVVDSGDAHAAIISIVIASEYIQSSYAGRLKIVSTLQDAPHELRFGVRRDWPELASAIDKVLTAIPEEEHRRIRGRWLTVRLEEGINWRRLAPVGGPLAAALLVIMGVILLANRRMREEIEQRRSLQKALSDNEERLRSILHSAPEAVVTVDSCGRITYWNPAAAQIFGYTEDEVLGHDVHALLAPPAVREKAQAAMPGFAETGEGAFIDRVVEATGLHKDGHEVPLDVARAAFREDDEWHAVAFVRNIGERRKAETERVEAMAMAEASRRRLLDMSDALPCAVYQIRLDADGSRHYTFVSKKVVEVLGVDLETLRRDEEARWRHVHEEDLPALQAIIDEVGRTGRPLFVEYRVRLPEGMKWVRQEALPQRQADGSLVWNGYWLDVTDIKKAEAGLSDQLLFQRLLLDSLPNPVFFKGVDGRFLGCNRACEETFGWGREDLIGRTTMELPLFPEDARLTYHEADLRLIREHASRHLQTRMRFADGRDHDVLYWATGFALSDGSPGGMIGVIVDISEQKRAETLVKETERWYRRILETAPDGMLVVDDAGRIILVNAQIEELFGYRREELIGQPVEMLVPEDLRGRHESHRRSYLEAAAARPMGAGLELYAVRKDGSRFPVEIGLSPLPGTGGKPPSVSASIRDISERKRSEDALREAKERAEEATQAKSMFLANMSHEIRTPMNAIIGMAHLALATGLTPQQRDYVGKIHGAAISLLAIINDILDFSKVEAGKLDMEQVDFSLDEVVASVSMVVGQRAEDKGLEVLFHPPVDPPTALLGDPLRLGQVLTNLVNNAVKFTERGEIEVTTKVVERKEDRVKLQFTVRDTGVGMGPEQIERLFQPFTQADGSTTRKYGGTGLGLTISKRLVEMMEGEIWADSVEGRGSNFHFTAWFGLGQEPRGARRELPHALTGMRVLVVDDNAAARQILVEALAPWPLQTETAASGEEALQAIRRADRAGQPFPLVLTDWNMPPPDGVELTRALKTDRSLSWTPRVIMTTAFGHDEVRRRAEAAGVDRFLIKPVSRFQLLDAVIDTCGPAAPPVAVPAQGAPSAATLSLAGLRVLVTEDNPINQQIAAELLRRAGISVDVAGNGREALERLRHHGPYDAVLMDLQMPEMDGIEATQEIRREPRLARLPVIAMTAHALVEERERCFAAGMNDHLTKPIDPESLFQALSRWTRPGSGAPAARTENLPLSPIGGVDTAGGMRRAGGSVRLYLSLLRQFVAEQADAAERIGAALAAGDRTQAERLAHTVHGVAGNVGAKSVQQTAGELEKGLRGGVAREMELALLTRFAAALDKVIVELQKTLGAPPAEGAPAPADDVDPIVRRLDALLADYDADAVEHFDAHREALRGRFRSADFAALERAVRSFDFEGAVRLLRSAAPAEANGVH